MRPPRIEILVDDLCTEIDRLEHKLDKANEEANYWRDRYQSALKGTYRMEERVFWDLEKAHELLLKDPCDTWETRNARGLVATVLTQMEYPK